MWRHPNPKRRESLPKGYVREREGKSTRGHPHPKRERAALHRPRVRLRGRRSVRHTSDCGIVQILQSVLARGNVASNNFPQCIQNGIQIRRIPAKWPAALTPDREFSPTYSKRLCACAECPKVQNFLPPPAGSSRGDKCIAQHVATPSHRHVPMCCPKSRSPKKGRSDIPGPDVRSTTRLHASNYEWGSWPTDDAGSSEIWESATLAQRTARRPPGHPGFNELRAIRRG